MGEVAYVSRVKVINDKPTFRRIYIPGTDEPLTVGFHEEVARLYKVPEGSYQPTGTTYDHLVAAVGG
jgi:hypothetical protein